MIYQLSQSKIQNHSQHGSLSVAHTGPGIVLDWNQYACQMWSGNSPLPRFSYKMKPNLKDLYLACLCGIKRVFTFKNMKICQRKRKTAAVLDYNEMVIANLYGYLGKCKETLRMVLVCVELGEIPPL